MLQYITFGLVLLPRFVNGFFGDDTNKCKDVTWAIYVPRMTSDDEATQMCSSYHCPRMGPLWGYTGRWYPTGDQQDGNMSTCVCYRKDCDCTLPMADDKPENYGMAKYHWEQDGCMLGWTQSYSNNTKTGYGTCGDCLGPCPWEDRDQTTRIVTSPQHCKVTKVSFLIGGGMSITPEYNSDQWLGVKLVDDDNRVIAHYNRTMNDDNKWTPVTWDNLPGIGCYRLVLHDGQVGSWSHILLQDVQIWSNPDDKMLHNLQCTISDHQNSTGWERTKGERLLGFGVEWGIDGVGTRQLDGRMTVGASYIYKDEAHPTVVTDVMIMTQNRNVGDVPLCPAGYERACYWLPEFSGDGFETQSFTALRTIKGVPAAICLKKEPCTPDKEYVKHIKARAGSSTSVPKTSDSCKLLGQWKNNPANGQVARSWTSGETGTEWAALYQCKEKCPHQSCANVVIRTMEKSSVASVQQSSAKSGASLQLYKELPNCYGTDPMDFTATLSTETDVTDQSSYTFSRALSHSFDSEISTSASIEASAGFKLCGNGVSAGGTRTIEVKADAGFKQSLSTSDSTVSLTGQPHTISATIPYTVQPGEVATLIMNVTTFEYSTNFVSEADCLDAGGNIIESTKLTGVFRGKEYRTNGHHKIESRNCHSDECTCSSSKTDKPSAVTRA